MLTVLLGSAGHAEGAIGGDAGAFITWLVDGGRGRNCRRTCSSGGGVGCETLWWAAESACGACPIQMMLYQSPYSGTRSPTLSHAPPPARAAAGVVELTVNSIPGSDDLDGAGCGARAAAGPA